MTVLWPLEFQINLSERKTRNKEIILKNPKFPNVN
jgi:signal recognition particle subunit SEC65